MQRERHPLAAAMDRFQEAHFWIHMLEMYYHKAEPFRWHLNVFLKALKEVPVLITMGMQNKDGFTKWYAQHKKSLKSDPLLQRDFVVHRGMLELGSSGSIGITKGRGMKLGLSFPIDPLMDSDEAMDHFVYSLAVNGDFFGLLAADYDTLPCVERHWKIPDFEEEIIEVCAKAWLRVGQTLADVVEWLGKERPNLNLKCLHSSQEIHFKLYKRKPLREKLRKFRSQDGFERAENSEDAADLAEDAQDFDEDDPNA